MEWPDGIAQRSDRDTRWKSRADGHPGGCPTESGRAPDEGHMGARWRVDLGEWSNGGFRGWLDRGVYKSGWPTFLGTLLQRPISPARNVGVYGANE
jgi:hypothetical protein